MLNKWKWLSLVFFLLSPLAWGHAHPKSESPGASDIIASNPKIVYIKFDSEIEPEFSTLRVLNQQNQQVSQGKGQVDPNNNYLLKTSVPALSSGNYQVFWSVVARDGHHTEGHYTFTVK